MYSPYARSLLTKLLQDAHEDEDEAVARTFQDLAADPTRFPEIRDFFHADRKEWPAVAKQARHASEIRQARMVARGEVRNQEEDERIEAETFYRLLAEHHVHTNPDAELRCLIQKPRFQRRRKRRTAYELAHAEGVGESPLSEVASSDDEGGDEEEQPKDGEKKLRIVIVKSSGCGGAGEGEWVRLAREACAGLKRKPKEDEDEDGEEGEIVERGPKRWKKARRAVRAEERDDEDDEMAAVKEEEGHEGDGGDEMTDMEEGGGDEMVDVEEEEGDEMEEGEDDEMEEVKETKQVYQLEREEDFEDVWMDEFD